MIEISGTITSINHKDNKTFIVLNQQHKIFYNSILDLSLNQKIACECKKIDSQDNKTIYYLLSYQLNYTKKEIGLMHYLSSGFFKGIGETHATTLINHFGESLISTLNNNYEDVLNFPSISKSTLSNLVKEWNKNNKDNESYIYLLQHGISVLLAKKIILLFQPNTIDIVDKNPYILTQIDGISFKTADRIGQSVGIPKDSEFRIEAALKHVLKEQLAFGHCFLEYSELIQKTSDLFDNEVNIYLIGQIANKLINNNTLREVNRMIYLPYVYDAEIQVSEKINILLTNNKPSYYHEANEFVNRLEKKQQFHKKQIEAIKISLQNNISIITGTPGTGKSTITRYICDFLDDMNVRYQLCAPTGKASKRLSEITGRGAVTIHRMLKYNMRDGYQFHTNNPLPYQCIIVDESSMLDILLCRHLMDALDYNTKIIFIGDYNQLPPIGPGNVLRDMILSEKIPCVKLTQIFRQDDLSNIIEVSHQILKGETPNLPTPKQSKGNNCMMVNVYEIEKLKEYLKILLDKTIPSLGFNMEDVQIISPMREKEFGATNLNYFLQDIMNPKTHQKQVVVNKVKYRVGDKVMQLRNSNEKGIFNGDVGYISDVIGNQENYSIYVNFPDIGEFEYTKTNIDEIQHSFCQTTHKMQGSEYPVVIFILHPSHSILLQRNLIYTGITRAKKLCLILGTQDALQKAIDNNKEMKRNTKLQEFIKKE